MSETGIIYNNYNILQTPPDVNDLVFRCTRDRRIIDVRKQAGLTEVILVKPKEWYAVLSINVQLARDPHLLILRLAKK